MRQLKITQQITSRETVSLNKYLQDIGSIPLLTAEEERTLPAKIQEGDERATKRFIEGNLRFVISVAKQYQGKGELLDDLVSAGNEGLITAAKRFDSSRGFKFISYAVWWIRQSIMQYLTENNKSIRLPGNKVQLVNKIRTVTSDLEQRLHRTPTIDEISEELFKRAQKSSLGTTELDSDIDVNDLVPDAATSRRKKKKSDKLSVEEIQHIMNANQNVSSLDVKLSEESESTLLDLLVFDGMDDVGHTLKQKDLQATIMKVLNKRLTPREKDTIIHSFGLYGNEPITLEEIGAKFDLTRERVRQIKEKALRKLKFSTASQEMKDYII